MSEIVKVTTDGGEYQKHESAYVDEGAFVGKGTKIWHFCHVLSGAKIGENCVPGQNVNVSSRAVIGNGVKIQNNVSVYDDVIIEDDVFCDLPAYLQMLLTRAPLWKGRTSTKQQQ